MNGGVMAVPSVKLGDGHEIPQVGLGLWKVKDAAELNESVAAAVKVGYRHFDTAQAYGNEGMLADALEAAGTKREDVFITTKIAVQHFPPYLLKSSLEKSLKRLKTDHVDLLLLHFPVTFLRHHAWRDMEAIHATGKARSIGVSNYTIRHLEELLKDCKVKPAVNQVEMHVFLQQPELLNYCRQQGIAVEAYSPLAHGYGMDNAVLVELAAKHHKSAPQIMLRWCVQKGMIVLPKSVHQDRVQANIELFDFSLDDDDMAQLKQLDIGHRTCVDPTHVK
jgi:diketogulonate reductase-like aldo/keto reductase